MTYTQLVQFLNQLLVLTDVYGQAMLVSLLPQIITLTENAMWRDPELDFLAMRVVDDTKITTRGSRAIPIPTNFVVIEGVSLVIPANNKPWIVNAQRIPLLRTTRQFIDFVWPVESQVQAPDPLYGGYFALFSEEEPIGGGGEADEPTPLPSSIMYAPTADDSYVAEITGTQFPAPISAANPTNFLSLYVPDLYVCKAMEYSTGALLKNYGAQADNPQQALSWKALYDSLKGDAANLERRKKAKIDGASPFPGGSGINPAMLAQMAQAGRPPG